MKEPAGEPSLSARALKTCTEGGDGYMHYVRLTSFAHETNATFGRRVGGGGWQTALTMLPMQYTTLR